MSNTFDVLQKYKGYGYHNMFYARQFDSFAYLAFLKIAVAYAVLYVKLSFCIINKIKTYFQQ